MTRSRCPRGGWQAIEDAEPERHKPRNAMQRHDLPVNRALRWQDVFDRLAGQLLVLGARPAYEGAE